MFFPKNHIFVIKSICHICKLLPPKMKNELYRLIGVEIGENVLIATYVQIDYTCG